MALNKIDNIEFDVIEPKDHPDYTNAYIVSADYNGVEMDEDNINKLNENSDFVHEQLIEHLN